MHTHLEWAFNAAAPGEQLGVQCLAQGSLLSRGQFLLEPRFEPTTSDYKSNALSIRATTAPLALRKLGSKKGPTAITKTTGSGLFNYKPYKGRQHYLGKAQGDSYLKTLGSGAITGLLKYKVILR